MAEESSVLVDDPKSPSKEIDLSTPTVGMLFNTLEDVEVFYNQYARITGFGVRRNQSYLDKAGQVVFKKFVCSKEGFKKPTSGEKKRKMGVTREGCKAEISVKKVKGEERWEIVKFVSDHTHPITTPSKRHFLRSNREVSSVHRNLINDFGDANIRTSQLMSILEIQSGGFDKVGCTEQDIRYYQNKRRLALKDCDAQIFINHLQEAKDCNDSFWYEYRVNDAKQLTDIFWADGLSRKAYHHFGDVLVFDSTYDTNEYALIMSPFVGINHHKQSVVFGCALLSNEKADTYMWLFETFVKTMSGKVPQTIITDQCPSMDLAIRRVFPHTHHRLCMWHIMKKLSEKVGVVLMNKKEFIDPFQRCVWNSHTQESFEEEWKKVIESNDLSRCEWLAYQYEIRHLWIPVYFKNVFLAGMRTTQRSEAMNAFMDKFVSKKLTLREFIPHFEMAMKRLRQKECKLDHDSRFSKPELATNFCWEIHLSKIYTRKIFYECQSEIKKSIMYSTVVHKVEGDIKYYSVSFFQGVEPESSNQVHRLVREVSFDMCTHIANCDCCLFESEGIPCRHIFAVLKNESVRRLPDFYVRKRWTINAAAEIVHDDKGIVLRGDESNEKSIADFELHRLTMEALNEANKSDDARALIIEGISEVIKRAKEIKVGGSKQQTIQDSVILRPITIENPAQTHAKGSGKRIKGAKEIAIERASKGRFCNACKQHGVNHDKRNCPLVKR